MITLSIAGFFQPDDVELFERACAAAHRELFCPANEHVTLLDMRELSIQSAAALERFTQLIAHPEFRSKRMAVVHAKSLAVRQLQRLTPDRRAQYFTDVPAARWWLLGCQREAA